MTKSFKPMLASEADLAKLNFPIFAQPKLDGIRVIVKDGVALTRSLKPVPNAEIQATIGCDTFNGFDGEIIVGDETAPECFNRSTSFVRNAKATGEPWVFHVFDRWDMPTATTLTRRTWLEEWFKSVRSEHIKLVPTWIAHYPEHLNAIEAEYVESGGEGLILRAPDSVYKFGRSRPSDGACLKLKRFTDAEAEIVSVYEQMHNANEAKTNALGRTERSSAKAGKVGKDTLGGFEVIGLNGEFAGARFRIGTGFNDDMRGRYWSTRHSLVGSVVKYKYVPVGSKDAPRFPVFLGFRDMELDS